MTILDIKAVTDKDENIVPCHNTKVTLNGVPVDGVLSILIDEIKPNGTIEATIKCNVSLGQDAS